MKLAITNAGLLITAIILSISSLLSAQGESQKKLFVTGLVEDLDKLDLMTGDLLLFQSKTFNGIMTQIGTLSPYTHCGIVIKNQDGSLFLLHCTDNDYYGNRIPLIDEDKGRSGIILTRLEDLFISTDGCKTGFYKHIWIRKFDDGWTKRPSAKKLMDLYKKTKKNSFTKSKPRFILAAFDFYIWGKDILSVSDDSTFFCSEFIHSLLLQCGIPVTDDQAINEYTPEDILYLEPYHDSKPVVFKFKNGLYRMK